MRSKSRCDYWWDDGVRYGLQVGYRVDDNDPATPAEEPITLTEARKNSRIDLAEDDDWIRDAIQEARELCEVFTKRCFVQTKVRLTLDSFPAWEFYLPRPPLISVSSIKYRDSAGVLQTIDSSDYTVDTAREPGRITPAYGESWPESRGHTNDVEVIYLAGYGAADDVPAKVKRAVKVTVSAWNEDREGARGLPDAAKSLLRANSWGFLP